jgi:hypothetical protein
LPKRLRFHQKIIYFLVIRKLWVARRKRIVVGGSGLPLGYPGYKSSYSIVQFDRIISQGKGLLDTV